ncbi:1,4-alpha-glucan branching protein GlgB [Peptococcaceae bacterium 1198_IL3148]
MELYKWVYQMEAVMLLKVFPIDDYSLYLFHEGTNYRSYQLLGAHIINDCKTSGVRFALWAPNAREISVVGDFNNWQGGKHKMQKVNKLGIWSTTIAGLKTGNLYKYEIITDGGEVIIKADPFAFFSELRPHTASVIYNLADYNWQDQSWQHLKKTANVYQQPILIYEVHLGSWKRDDDNNFLNYRQLAKQLVDYVVEMGYTHIELLPVSEHPLDDSWGYQTTGYYSATSRYGTPHQLMYLIDQCHQRGVGVILDLVLGHFCKDSHGLRCFDGTAVYENDNLLKSENHQWGTANFDFTKPEVWSFLISNVVFWLDIYHIDGVRLDAVANMLYLDYAKEPGQWVSNKYGGNENLEAVAFLKRLNEVIFKYFPNTLVMAEESSQWPLVTKPTYVGGLGFNFKWNMGWMNDILKYMDLDPVNRKWHHNQLTFSFMYTYAENYVLPLSHDEVVHGKKSLLDKMPGDYWQKFANLRLLFGYMMAHPGKKLLFMGAEFGQFAEWQFDKCLDWQLLNYELHNKTHNYVKALNHFYRNQRCLWELDHEEKGLEWIDANDYNQSIITFVRRGKGINDYLIVICNFTPVVREKYRIGVPEPGTYIEVFNSDLEVYGGSNNSNDCVMTACDVPWHNRCYSIEVKIPPLAVLYLKPDLNDFKR